MKVASVYQFTYLKTNFSGESKKLVNYEAECKRTIALHDFVDLFSSKIKRQPIAVNVTVRRFIKRHL